MAAYESYGYCPSNAFGLYRLGKPKSEQEQRAYNMLTRYHSYMVYEPHQCMPGTYGDGDDYWCTIVDATIGGGKSFLGVEVACHLRTIVPCPDAEFEEHNLKIVIRDTYDIGQFYAIGRSKWRGNNGDENDVVSFYTSRNTVDLKNPKVAEGSAYLFYDDRYIVVVDNHTEEGKETLIITIEKR